VLLLLVDVVGARDELEDDVPVEDDALVKPSEDCGAVFTGDHDALATAEKVSVGGEPLHPEFPQHSHAKVFWFHWIHVSASPASDSTNRQYCSVTANRLATHCKMFGRHYRHMTHPCSRQHSSSHFASRLSLARIVSLECNTAVRRRR
jgi:hypothetical protein